MIRHLGSSLTDVSYVFDEPTIGLHPHDIQRMNGLLVRLRDKGNTVLVVEHKPEAIQIADYVVDLGPRAGVNGGEVCYTGAVEGLRTSGTLTGRHLDDRARLKSTARAPTGRLAIRGARRHNLRDVDVDLPLGVLRVVTGVAGSGKSSLIHSSMPRDAGVISVDQSAIKGSRRSNPATYTGLLDGVRSAFAKANKVKPGLFSANSEGACLNCNGLACLHRPRHDGWGGDHLRGVQRAPFHRRGAAVHPRRPDHRRRVRDVGRRRARASSPRALPTRSCPGCGRWPG